MKVKADSFNIVQDILNGGFVIQMHVTEIPTGVETLREGPLAVSVTKWRERRTLTANAYYWVLVSKIADIAGLPTQKVHNMLLRRYGVPETMDGDLMTVFIPDGEDEEVLMKELYHLKSTSLTKTGKDGKVFRAYILLKGSSSMDSKEFSTLVDGTVTEAKDLGIETLPSEELERMMEDYEKHFAGR